MGGKSKNTKAGQEEQVPRTSSSLPPLGPLTRHLSKTSVLSQNPPLPLLEAHLPREVSDHHDPPPLTHSNRGTGNGGDSNGHQSVPFQPPPPTGEEMMNTLSALQQQNEALLRRVTLLQTAYAAASGAQAPPPVQQEAPRRALTAEQSVLNSGRLRSARARREPEAPGGRNSQEVRDLRSNIEERRSQRNPRDLRVRLSRSAREREARTLTQQEEEEFPQPSEREVRSKNRDKRPRDQDPVAGPAAEDFESVASPYCKEIQETLIPRNLKVPKTDEYDGSTDPIAYIKRFNRMMDLQGVPSHLRCKALGVSLSGLAGTWFDHLKPCSITSFNQLCKQMTDRFAASKTRSLTDEHLMRVKQGAGESIKSFLDRFQTVATQVENYTDALGKLAFLQGLHRDESFAYTLRYKKPDTFSRILRLAERHIEATEAMGEEPHPKKEKLEEPAKRFEKSKTSFEDRSKDDSSYGKPPQSDKRFEGYTPLNKTPSHILLEIKNQGLAKLPEKPTRPKIGGDQSKFCKYHQYNGHNTNDCFALKDEIERLINSGELRHYVAGPGKGKEQAKNDYQ